MKYKHAIIKIVNFNGIDYKFYDYGLTVLVSTLNEIERYTWQDVLNKKKKIIKFKIKFRFKYLFDCSYIFMWYIRKINTIKIDIFYGYSCTL